MDHLLTTAQHNAVHLLEMVQDVMFKLLKRQQNAQFIVAFLQLVASVLTVERFYQKQTDRTDSW